MKISRRQALWGTLGLGIGAIGFLGLRKFYQIYAAPDLTALRTAKTDLESLVEAIIPSNPNNPGAKETHTAQFVLLAIEKCTETKTQNNFIAGLLELSSRAKYLYDKSLPDCSLDERVELLAMIEEESETNNSLAKKVKRKLFGDTFIFTLKRLTVWGYCTSEAGATRGLSYDYIPARFVGDVRLIPGQKSWATS